MINFDPSWDEDMHHSHDISLALASHWLGTKYHATWRNPWRPEEGVLDGFRL
jgi:hypothetical protein